MMLDLKLRYFTNNRLGWPHNRLVRSSKMPHAQLLMCC